MILNSPDNFGLPRRTNPPPTSPSIELTELEDVQGQIRSVNYTAIAFSPDPQNYLRLILVSFNFKFLFSVSNCISNRFLDSTIQFVFNFRDFFYLTEGTLPWHWYYFVIVRVWKCENAKCVKFGKCISVKNEPVLELWKCVDFNFF